MAKSKQAQWPWHLLTGLILLVLAASLWLATSTIAYEWRWNRVPQYFVYHAEEAQRAAELAEVAELTVHGAQTDVTLRNSAGVEQQLTVDSDSVHLSIGDEVEEGDQVGVTRHWAAGPLAWGLLTTLWISLAAGAMGLLIGVLTGCFALATLLDFGMASRAGANRARTGQGPASAEQIAAMKRAARADPELGPLINDWWKDAAPISQHDVTLVLAFQKARAIAARAVSTLH